MSENVERALEAFGQGFSYSQTVLLSHSADFGLEDEMAMKAADAFGGGMGRIEDTCGAVTGAPMLIGLKYGKTKAERGSIKCMDLIGYDISVKEGLVAARKAGSFKTACPLLIRESIEIVERLL